MEQGYSSEQVMSEVHLGCPPRCSGSYVTHFTFSLPPKVDFIGEKMISLDKDGDLVLARRKGQSFKLDDDGDLVQSRKRKICVTGSICKLTIQHSITSSLPNVGLQVWMAALLLSDYLLHISFISSDFDDITVLELGAGTALWSHIFLPGLAGIVLARIAKTVFLTDYGNEILDNCAKNVHRNSSFSELNEASIHVRELNWKGSWPPTETIHKSKYSWTPSEVAEAEEATLILAADVIYNDDLTESLFNILEELMSRGSEKVLYLALEKRYNFSLDDLDVVANGYARFRSFFKDEEECRIPDDVSFPCFVGAQIDIFKIPQYIREYERGRDLELWKIRYCMNRSQLLLTIDINSFDTVQKTCLIKVRGKPTI